MPGDAPVGIFHGDFQWSNLFYSKQGQLLAVIDWEFCGIKPEAYDLVRPIFEAISAKVDGEACVTHIGPRGSGHFVIKCQWTSSTNCP